MSTVFGVHPRSSSFFFDPSRKHMETTPAPAAVRVVEIYPDNMNEVIHRVRSEAYRKGFVDGQLYAKGRPVEKDGKADEEIMVEICQQVSRKHSLPFKALFDHRRPKQIVRARHEAVWRASKETHASLPTIGRFFGFDHTSILHAIRKHQSRIDAGEAT